MPHADPEARRAYARNWYSRNREKILAARVPWSEMSEEKREYHRTKSREHFRALPSDVKRERALKRTYGITLADKNQMLAAQDNRCAICRVLFVDEKSAHVDHDHSRDRAYDFHQKTANGGERRKPKAIASSGSVRGLLCHLCNNGLGSFHDDVDFLRAAIAYLEKHK